MELIFVAGKKHHWYNIDTAMKSDKFNHPAWWYEIALSVFESKCVLCTDQSKALPTAWQTVGKVVWWANYKIWATRLVLVTKVIGQVKLVKKVYLQLLADWILKSCPILRAVFDVVMKHLIVVWKRSKFLTTYSRKQNSNTKLFLKQLLLLYSIRWKMDRLYMTRDP